MLPLLALHLLLLRRQEQDRAVVVLAAPELVPTASSLTARRSSLLVGAALVGDRAALGPSNWRLRLRLLGVERAATAVVRVVPVSAAQLLGVPPTPLEKKVVRQKQLMLTRMRTVVALCLTTSKKGMSQRPLEAVTTVKMERATAVDEQAAALRKQGSVLVAALIPQWSPLVS